MVNIAGLIEKIFIAQIINEEKPLLIVTQELLPHMVLDLEKILKEYTWVGKPRSMGDEYNAIFYRKDLIKRINHGTFWLSETPAVEGSISWDATLPRICTWVEVETIDSKFKFRLFNTYLDHVSKEAWVHGIKIIKDFINQINAREQLPTILTGDFNTEHPADEEVAFWTKKSGFISVFTKMEGKQKTRKTFHDFKCKLAHYFRR